MASLNKTLLLGNVGKDPEIKTFSSGDEVANFSIATSESWRDKATGEKKEKTEWHNISVYGNLVSVVKNYVKKGTKLYIEGQLETRKWQDQTGQDRYSTSIVLRGFDSKLILLSAKDNIQDIERGESISDEVIDDNIPF